MISQNAKWIKSWEWPDEINELIKSLIDGPGESLHICAGSSEIGDFKIDLDPQKEDIQKMDMRDLKFPSYRFNYTIIDPPWKLGYYQRFRPFYEAVRVTNIGGFIIYNATWIPKARNVELIETYIRRDSDWGNISVISVFKKIAKDPPRRDIVESVE